MIEGIDKQTYLKGLTAVMGLQNLVEQDPPEGAEGTHEMFSNLLNYVDELERLIFEYQEEATDE